MSREWKPGDVGVLDGYMVAIVTAWMSNSCGPRHTKELHWHRSDGDWNHLDASFHPLAVIDPEDREQVERLAGLLQAVSGQGPATVTERWTLALREFADPKPPKPDEPLGLGAVVEDADLCRWIKIDVHKRCNDWTRIGAPSHPDPERSDGKSVRWTYADISAVRILSDGVVS